MWVSVMEPLEQDVKDDDGDGGSSAPLLIGLGLALGIVGTLVVVVAVVLWNRRKQAAGNTTGLYKAI